jgi:hypothetical protein
MWYIYFVTEIKRLTFGTEHGLWYNIQTFISYHTPPICIWVSEWLLFNANSEIVKLYHGENKLIFNVMMMRSARPTRLVEFFIVLTHWWTCRPTRTHYPDSEPTSLCSFFLMLYSLQRSNKYQFYSLVWPDRGSNPPSSALETSTLTIPPPMRLDSTKF